MTARWRVYGAALMLMGAGGVMVPDLRAVTATGGNSTQDVNGYRIHLFTNSATASNLVVTGGGSVEVLVVGGGGGGGGSASTGGWTGGGGGGGGGVVYTNALTVEAGSNYTVVVGAGGAGGLGADVAGAVGSNGANSSFASLVAYGGGGGGRGGDSGSALRIGLGGGSGGGSGYRSTAGGPAVLSGAQGFAGGYAGTGEQGSGGGGGAGAVGGNGWAAPTNYMGGNGGIGRALGLTGTTNYYGGGGGAGGLGGYGNAGDGGVGGGGAGAKFPTTAAVAGTANTGGGGGGGTRVNAGQGNNPGAAGGSGIVIIRYLGGLAVQVPTASGVGPTNATLNGKVLSVGDAENPHVYFCWGDEDAGTNAFPGAWDQVGYQGTNGGLGQSFSTNIGGLLSGSSYRVRCFASNTTGTAWSDLWPFTTVYPPAVTNLGVTQVGVDSAELNGAITDTGGENPSVGFEYWPTSGGVTSTVAIGPQGGVFTHSVVGLLPSVDYAYRILASNSAGPAWSTVSNFITRAGIYVAASGDNSDGSSWDKAFTDLQIAITACWGQVSLIYIKSGVYFNDAPVVIATNTATYTNSACYAVSNHPGLTLRGGYAGNTDGGLPGTLGADPTILTVGAVTTRIFYAANSTITVDRVTVSNGMALAGSDSVRYGSGLYLSNCVALVTNGVLVRNGDMVGGARLVYGGGIYVRQGRLTVASSSLITNGFPTYAGGERGFGGGLYALDAVLTLSDVRFDRNSMNAYDNTTGGALYTLRGTQTVLNCRFERNYVRDANGNAAILVLDTPISALVSNCVVENNRGYAYYNPAVIDTRGTAGGVVGFEDCVIRNNRMTAQIAGYLPSAVRIRSSSGAVLLRHCEVVGNDGAGIYRVNGTAPLALTNCLIAGNGVDGVCLASAGNLSLANCTIAHNAGGLGVTNNGAGTVTVRDSIFWGNGGGGCAGNNLNVTYSSLQEPRAGTGNMVTNPGFIAGYYLAKTGLPAQSVDSPCRNAGSDTAANLGLNGRATTTDNAADDGQVDLGYHFTQGVPDSAFSNLVLYVDVNTGDDTGDGWTPGTALKTISNAFTRAMDGTRIHLAAGTYTTNTEVFPLEIPYPNLSLVGTNRGLTVLDGKATHRVVLANNKAGLWFEGLTVSNGWSSIPLEGHYGGNGFFLRSCQAVITNCVIVRNGFGNLAPVNGAGVYVFGGSLTVADSIFRTNGWATFYGATLGSGGGLCAVNGARMTLDNVLFERNIMNGYDSTYGGALYMIGGALTMRGCEFLGNYMHTFYGRGLVELESLTSLFASSNRFIRNVAYGYSGNNILAVRGTGGAGLRIEECLIVSNTATFNATYGNMAAGLLAGIAGGALDIQRCEIGSNTCSGLGKEGTGTAGFTNGLIYGSATNGIRREGTGSLSIGNSTIASNAAWGLTNAAAGSLTVINSIVWDNRLGGVGGAATITYSDVQGGFAGTGNFDLNPRFAGWGEAPFFSLKSGSPCLNSGLDEPWMDTGVDLLGKKRRMGGVDRGCYESQLAAGTIFIIR